MKTIGLIIALLFSVSSWGATPARVESLEMGGRVITDLSKVEITLVCLTLSNTTTCTKDGSIYTAGGTPVTGGFRFYAIRMQTTGTTPDGCGFGYDTATLENVACAGTAFGPSAACGGALNRYQFYSVVPPNQTDVNQSTSYGTYFLGDTGYLVPQGEKPWMQCNSATNYKVAYVYGYEE